MINILGYPSKAFFGTYAYSASYHLDQDEGPTTGYVIQRPENVSFFLRL